MFAVVQIGSKARRSPCITARTVLAAAGAVWARRTPGALARAAAAAPDCSNVRRVVVMGVSPRALWPGLAAIYSRRGRRGQARSLTDLEEGVRFLRSPPTLTPPCAPPGGRRAARGAG